jgi:hypothetical protein
MLRYLLTAASVMTLVSGAAMAQTVVETHVGGPKTVAIAPAPGAAQHRTITKRYINHRGMMVTKRKTIHEGFAGSSVERTKTVHDPLTGMSRTRTEIER